LLAAARRSGDETHPWPLNGDLRPLCVIRPEYLNGSFQEKREIDN
jgi:hypothetical protein